MMPGHPVPTLRIGQPRLTLRPLEAFLDAMLRLRHPRQFLQRGARVRVRESTSASNILTIITARILDAGMLEVAHDMLGKMKQLAA